MQQLHINVSLQININKDGEATVTVAPHQMHRVDDATPVVDAPTPVATPAQAVIEPPPAPAKPVPGDAPPPPPPVTPAPVEPPPAPPVAPQVTEVIEQPAPVTPPPVAPAPVVQTPPPPPPPAPVAVAPAQADDGLIDPPPPDYIAEVKPTIDELKRRRGLAKWDVDADGRPYIVNYKELQGTLRNKVFNNPTDEELFNFGVTAEEWVNDPQYALWIAPPTGNVPVPERGIDPDADYEETLPDAPRHEIDTSLPPRPAPLPIGHYMDIYNASPHAATGLMRDVFEGADIENMRLYLPRNPEEKAAMTPEQLAQADYVRPIVEEFDRKRAEQEASRTQQAVAPAPAPAPVAQTPPPPPPARPVTPPPAAQTPPPPPPPRPMNMDDDVLQPMQAPPPPPPHTNPTIVTPTAGASSEADRIRNTVASMFPTG